MDEKNHKIAEYWRSAYSENIQDYKSYDIPKNFNQIASLFAPGNSYYYMINFHNLELEFISPSIQKFTDTPLDVIDIIHLLQIALPEEVEHLKLKEKVIQDFFTNYLKRKNILDYKIMYSYKMKDKNGKTRTMLHQATALSVDKNGFFLHVFSVHSDISHLNVVRNNNISFMNLKGGRSFYNVDISNGKFDPAADHKKNQLNELLSEREKEIVSEIALGLSNDKIGDKLSISPHTVKTHRKNIMQKSGCESTAQLVANCLVGGVINTGM